MEKIPSFSFKLITPRYWLGWFAIIILWFFVLLPYPMIEMIGKSFGRASMMFLRKRKRIAEKNLKLCFPHLTSFERKELLISNFESVGMGIMETGMAWFWPDWRVRKWFSITGYEHMQNALDSKKGVLLIGMHFLTLELGARIFGILNPGIGVYRPNNNALLDWLQTWGRMRSNKTMLDRNDLKGMLKSLNRGEILWYAPDHDYGPKNSVFAPFFAVKQAATTTGSYMLIRSTQPAVIPFVPRRRHDGGGYELIIMPDISANIPIHSKQETAAYINKSIEGAVLLSPEQYMWLHRRFKTRPKGVQERYN
ncbi:Kdo(2)-lipid IV(A) acyltransferase [Candidatus Pantoea soli]|uniref:Lipid A biosynthesis acyltransferase n=1 Tax=Candidatus Pantoea soli TaxID=3098669 RepID=A0A518XJL4_9GAMM|nr:Kdo(2)-lipid IV(A) acyltransferase [Pantoea soli]QDY44379.1 LpxL/LpxP family Kdo(2)-lipid IV(A) lauroyl/palmitoleoyl acyltransferase [Pantoea soli]